MNARIATLTLVSLALTAGVARADSYVSIPEQDYASSTRHVQTNPVPSWHVRHLEYPVLGMPSLVEPSGKITLRILLPDGGRTRDFQAVIETSAPAAATTRFALPATGQVSYEPLAGVYAFEVQVPAGAPAGVYDLEVSSAAFTLTQNGKDRQPCCVRILNPARPNPSFVIVTDSQLQDLNTTVGPERLAEMLGEIRLRDPDFCLYCGDVNFGSDYATEYEENWKLFARSGIAIFFIPGNHDGYSTVVPLTSGNNPPGRIERDGLVTWRLTFGPTNYSFDWLGLHFVGVNSMDGPPERRNSVGILSTNYGGQIDQEQRDWIEQDVKAATARGKTSVVFMHHNPTAPLTPNIQGYPVPIPSFSWQDWNDKTSADFLIQLATTQPVSHFFLGHVHQDTFAEKVLGTRKVQFVATTTMDCGPQSSFGYRWVTTRNGRVDEVNYMGPKQGSVPFPMVGLNLALGYSAGLDGASATLDAAVASRLLGPASVVLDLPVAPSAGGLRVRGAGSIESVAVTTSGTWVARVRGTVPASGSIVLGVEPDPTGRGIVPRVVPPSAAPSTSAATSSLVAGATAAASPAPGGSGGSGGCALVPGGGSARAAFLPLLVLVALLGTRRRALRAEDSLAAST